ncbi:MAG: hypothetical protein MJ168_06280 [Clostridia bacterium]|nr:hypothetical protein [Clostridia bacterium]
MTSKEESALAEFIENERYTAVVQRLADGGSFSLPTVSFVNKGFSEKKRTVFTFPEEENYVQKMIAFLLLDYEILFADNLYSFRRNMGVKKAVAKLKSVKNISSMYSFKIDVSDYFNSVNADKLIPMIKTAIPQECAVISCFEEMLTNPYAIKDWKKVEIKKGIMAGVPLSAFFANLYLSEMDWYFSSNNILYARYSDDIIVFAETVEKLNEYKEKILGFVSKLGLGINEKKVFTSEPNEEWTFLGFKFSNGKVDISDIAVRKIKAKMRRKMNALIRWKHRKNAEPERAVRAFIRHFNKKFFDNPMNNEITWCRWFFPVIDTAESLHMIDAYMQECIRYIATEKRTKAQFNFRYEDMKRLGYLSLVNSYYEFKNHGTYPAMHKNKK